MIDCQGLPFSPVRAQQRIEKALLVFPKALLFRLLAFSLYLLGVPLKELSVLLGIPEESIRTYARVACRDGVPALVDRRRADAPAPPPAPQPEPSRPSVRVEDGCLVIALAKVSGEIQLPATHQVQARTVLLTLANSGLLSLPDVATALGLSQRTCRHLAHELQDHDVDQALVDKRQGQTQDYRFGPAQKAELIQQFAARAVTGHSTRSEDLAEAVGQATGASSSPRTIRWHVARLGLDKIRDSLPELVSSLKKTPDPAS